MKGAWIPAVGLCTARSASKCILPVAAKSAASIATLFGDGEYMVVEICQILLSFSNLKLVFAYYRHLDPFSLRDLPMATKFMLVMLSLAVYIMGRMPGVLVLDKFLGFYHICRANL